MGYDDRHTYYYYEYSHYYNDIGIRCCITSDYLVDKWQFLNNKGCIRGNRSILTKGELNKEATETECHMQQRLQTTTESVVGDLGICPCMFFFLNLLQLLNTLVKIHVYLKLFIHIVHDLLPAGVASYPIKYGVTGVTRETLY